MQKFDAAFAKLLLPLGLHSQTKHWFTVNSSPGRNPINLTIPQTLTISNELAALNIKWWHHVPNSELYDNLPEVGDKVAARRTGLVGHCSRHPELLVGKVILWEPITNAWV